MLYKRQIFCPSLQSTIIHLVYCANAVSIKPPPAHAPRRFTNGAACTLKTACENKPPYDIIHPPPWVNFRKLVHQKLVAKIVSHLGVLTSFPKGHPFGTLAVTSKIRCDPIDAIGSPPPMASLHSPPKRNPQKHPYTKNGHTLRPTPTCLN
jgi:hypothetical protein